MSLIILYSVAGAQSDTQISVAMAWSMDGIKLAVGYQGGRVGIFDSLTGELLWAYQFSDVVTSLEWHPTNPNRLAIGGGDFARAEGIVQILDVATSQTLLTLDGGESINAISWSPDGAQLAAASNTLFATATARNEVRIWDTTTGELLTTIAPVSFGNITAVDWSPDGSKIAGGTSDYIVAIWDTNTGNVLHTLQGHSATILSVAWSPDSDLLASISFGLDNTLRIWDTVSGQGLTTFPTDFAVDVAWSPTRNELAVAEGDGVRLIDTTTGEVLAKFPAIGLQQALAYSPYSARLAFGGESSNILEESTPDSGDMIARVLSRGAVWIVTPFPSLDRLNAIAALCVRDGDTGIDGVQAVAETPDSLADLPAFIARVGALPADAIPPACAADLLAVAEALLSEGE